MIESDLRDDCNCFAFRQATRFVTQIYERHLAPVGLTAAQFTILTKIGKSPSISMAELAHCMVMDRTSLVRALAPLQREGLIASEPSDLAKRAQLHSLTAAGKAMLAKARYAWRAAQEEFEGKVGREQARFLREELFNLTQARD